MPVLHVVGPADVRGPLLVGAVRRLERDRAVVLEEQPAGGRVDVLAVVGGVPRRAGRLDDVPVRAAVVGDGHGAGAGVGLGVRVLVDGRRPGAGKATGQHRRGEDDAAVAAYDDVAFRGRVAGVGTTRPR